MTRQNYKIITKDFTENSPRVNIEIKVKVDIEEGSLHINLQQLSAIRVPFKTFSENLKSFYVIKNIFIDSTCKKLLSQCQNQQNS